MATAPPRTAKRTRIDAPSNVQSSSPLAAAKNLVQQHCESLQHNLQELLKDSAIKHFLIHMELANRKQRAVSKMEDTDTYVPRSLKLNCTLHCSELAKQDPEYTNLAETLATVVSTFQNAAKATVISATKLDVKVHKTAATKTLCEAIYKVSTSFMTLNDHNLAEVHKFAHSIIDRHYEEMTPMFGLTEFATLEQFKQRYINYTTATAPLPHPFIAPDAHLAHNPAAGIANPYAAANNAVNINATTRKNENTIDSIWRTIRICFIDSWQTFLRQQKDNDTALKMKHLSTTLLVGAATEAAQMQVDQEPAVTPALLRKLIAEGTAQAVAPLQATIKRLEAKGKKLETQVKNNPRGPRGASRKQSNPGRGNQHQPRADQEADAPVNASPHENRNKNSRSSNKRSGGRTSNSARGGNKRQQRSGRRQN